MKKVTYKSSSELWCKAHDESLLTAVTDAITINCEEICKEAFPNKNRHAHACQIRWEKHLNPALAKNGISPEEQQSIIKSFNKHGYKFSAYSINRSEYQISTFLYKHVCSIHKADGGIQFYLFKTLQDLLHKNSKVSFDQWATASAKIHNHSQCYKNIIRSHIEFLHN